MKETYLSRDFRETAAQRFSSHAKELKAFFDTRLNALLAENADASKEKQYHLKRQILPGIAAYETLQRVMQMCIRDSYGALPDFEEACKRANVPYTVSARPKMVHCLSLIHI